MDILRIAALGTAGVSVPASAFLPGPSEKCSICSACSHK